ncbi:MAG: hypothetical protein ACOYEV_01680 [Candidatus Nanopelagicales bacterium]
MKPTQQTGQTGENMQQVMLAQAANWGLAGMFVLMLGVAMLGIAALVWYSRHR